MSGRPNPSEYKVTLMQRMQIVMLCDRHQFVRRINQLKSKELAKRKKLEQDIIKSTERAAFRRKRFENIAVLQKLPIAEKASEIVESIKSNPVTIVSGATGSGKTTQLPKLCLQAGYGVFGSIGHTQPRRIAARATAQRIAEEMACPVGDGVGYKVRFSDHTGPDCQVKLLTDGMLLQESFHDPQLMDYDCLIIDEAHERSLNIDFLLGLLKQLLRKRPQLKVLITSATINPAEFSQFFDNAPVIEVSGRSFPIDIEYFPGDQLLLSQHVSAAVSHLWEHHEPGNVLVFLPGEREILETQRLLQGQFSRVEVLPLFARLPLHKQQLIFAKNRKLRIILATNVAETSLTVPGIVYVIDSGYVRTSRYNYRSKLQRLSLENTSQASADQRAGRCGRVRPGVCVRLYSADEQVSREPFDTPEILRTNLASVILRMSVLGLGIVEDFPFVDRPDGRFIKDGYRILEQLQAVNSLRQVTKLGRKMSLYPLDPRLAKIFVSAANHGCLSEIKVIVAGLAAGDPGFRNNKQPHVIAKANKAFIDKTSDFVTLLNIWKKWSVLKGGNQQRRKWCNEHGLSFTKMQEWHDVFLQLTYLSKERRLPLNVRPASRAKIHIALLRGFFDYIGRKESKGVYLGARDRRFKIFPGSVLAKTSATWVMAAEIVETSQVFAHQVAVVEPGWIELAASHITKKQCIDHVWNRHRACPMGVEQVTLFGFVLNRSRQVPLAKHDGVNARCQFIQYALVENRWNYRAEFVVHNQSLRDQMKIQEAKLRRVLLNEQQQFDVFNQFIDKAVVDKKSFLAWYEAVPVDMQQRLFLELSDVGESVEVSDTWYPDSMRVAGNDVKLTYVFDPSDERDGVTLHLPGALISHVRENQLEWLIPGWLKAKVEALLKRLPKVQRKNLVPINDTARDFLVWAIDDQLLGGSESLLSAMSRYVETTKGVAINHEAWADNQLPVWMHLAVSIIDKDGLERDWGRNFSQLVQKTHTGTGVQAHESDSEWLKTDIVQWDFGVLPDVVAVRSEGVSVTACPVLVDKIHRIDMELVATLEDSSQIHANGVVRLIARHLQDKFKYLQKNLPDLNRVSVLFLHLGDFEQLFDDMFIACIKKLVPAAGNIRNSNAFAEAVKVCRSAIVSAMQNMACSVLMVLGMRQQISMQLDEHRDRLTVDVIEDMKGQLDNLVHAGLVRETPERWLSEIPRYLEALERRLQKLLANGNESKDVKKIRVHQKRLNAMSPEEITLKPDYGWMLEEWRVSVFAQELGTKVPISERRIEKYLSSRSPIISK